MKGIKIKLSVRGTHTEIIQPKTAARDKVTRDKKENHNAVNFKKLNDDG